MSLKEALEKVERKEFKQAKELLEPICNVSKKRWRAWTLLSLVYLSLDEPKKAYEASNVAWGKNAPLAEYVKAKAMYILDMDNKLKQLEHALEIDCDCLYTLKLAPCLPEIDGAILLEKSARTKSSQTETCIKMFYRAAQKFSKLGRKTDALRNFQEVAKRCETLPSLKDLGEIARYKVAALGNKAKDNETIARAPESYIKRLYDSFASTFDETLVKKLAYRTPTEISSLIGTLNLSFKRGCDLGCGTGLSGLALRRFVSDSLVGVDLSTSMVELAKKRGIYEELHVSEIVSFLKNSSTCFDLIVSCDVFVYLGDLDDTFQQVSKSLSSNGVFAFSTEQQIQCGGDKDECSCTSPYILDITKRFKHCSEYVLKLSKTHGFALIRCLRGRIIRKQGKSNVKGDIFLLRKGK
eukprot:g6371.t1